MKRILFYYPSNKRSNVIETTLEFFKSEGYEVYFRSSCERGDLHEWLKKKEIKVSASPFTRRGLLYYPRQILDLISFCRQHKIDIVLSNLQHANFIAVFAQFFIPSRLVTFRHHFKFDQKHFDIPLKVNRNERRFDSWINRLSKEIVVPAESIKQNMVHFEGVSPSKIKVLPYLYDFSAFKMPEMEEVEQIKQKFKAQLRLIMVARLIPFKRHALILPLIHKLVKDGLDIQLLILDEGPEKPKLEAYVKENGLQERIIFLGFQKQPLNFIAASDMLIHPSLTEASNNVVKECGLLNKAVMVCKGVGDFDEYLIDGKNGFLLDKEYPIDKMEELIRIAYSNPQRISEIGEELNKTISQKFGNWRQHVEAYRKLLA